jgi:YD repeat-containing protein
MFDRLRHLALAFSFRRLLHFLVLSLSMLWMAAGHVAPLRGQNPDQPQPVPGFQRDQAYWGAFPFEHIDTGSGNLILTFTDFSLPGYGGLDLVFQRTFNSAQGWWFGLVGFPMKVARPAGPLGSPGNPPDFENPDSLPLILGADGGAHRTWWDGDSQVEPVFLTADFWRYHSQDRRLELPNGIQCFYDALGLLIEVRDRFSNRIEIVNETYGEGTQGHPTLIRQILGDGRVRELNLTYIVVTNASGDFQVLNSAAFEGRTWSYQYGGRQGLDVVAAIPPVGPRWSFAYPGPPDDPPGLTVTVPQGGQILYTFVDSVSPEVYGTLTSRKTRDGTTDTSEWTFTFDDPDMLAPGYRRIVDGPSGARHIYEYEPGPAVGGAYTLRAREVWDRVSNVRLERETRTYTTTQVVPHLMDTEGHVRNLLKTLSLERDGHFYDTTLLYKAGTAAERFADYGRPWRIFETGDAGSRYRDRGFDYDFSGYLIDRIASETLTAGGSTYTKSWAYDNATGFLDSSTRYGVPTTYTADAATGTLAGVTDAHGHETTFTYDWGVVKNTTTPLFAITRTINSDGTASTETRRGQTTTYEYDGAGRIRWVKPPVGHWFETQYDNASGRWVTILRGDGAGHSSWTNTSADVFGRTIGTETSVGVRTAAGYDAMGRKNYETLPYQGATVGGSRSFDYDLLNRLKKVTHTDGRTVQYAYASGVDVTITDEQGHTTEQDWAAFGDPSAARLTGVTDGEGRTWTYEYSGVDQLTRVNQPPAQPGESATVRTWSYYGGTDLLESETHPESGTTTYTYDASGGGRLATKVTPAPGGTFTFGYDNNDRITSVTAPDAAHSLTMEYDASDNRTVLSNSFVTSAFNYDAANRLNWRKDTFPGQPVRQTTYHYDGWDNVESIDYPSGRTASYLYDSENRVTKVSRTEGQSSLLVAEVLSYHPSGAIKQLKMGNNIIEDFAFDPNRYWLTTISGGPLSLLYTYSPVGNVNTIVNGNDASRNQQFTYDNIDRLSTVSGFGATSFSHDALGNRTSKSAPNVAYAYDPATNRLASATGPTGNPEIGSYGYDASGNMTGDPSGTYTYTPFNMLQTATVGGAATTYRYDGDNLRAMRVSGGTTSYLIHGPGGQLLSEWKAADWERDYIYLGSRLVASVTPAQSVTVRFTQATATIGEGAGTLIATMEVVTGDGQPLRQAASVAYASANGTALAGGDYTAVNGVLTFAASTPSSSTQTMSVPIVSDIEYEPAETFRLDLSSPAGAVVGSPASQTVTVDDDESPIVIDQPLNGAAITGPFRISGWAVDPAAASGTGVDAIHVHAYPNPGSGQPAIFVGAATYGDSRPDVGAIYGARFTNAGYHLDNVRLKPGTYLLVVFAHRTRTQQFDLLLTVTVGIAGMAVDTPAPEPPEPRVNWTFLVSGWAVDPTATTGTGIAQVTVRAVRVDGQGPPVTITPQYGFDRGDIAAIFGASFRYSGYAGWITLPPARYRLEVSSYDAAATVLETTVRYVTVVQPDPVASVNPPVQGATVTQPFLVAGWAIDRNAPSGTGVDTVHLWAFANSGAGPATFLGVATYGAARSDVATIYGSQFTNSGFNQMVSGLAPGTYLVAVYPHSTITGSFDYSITVTVTVQ